ncbi:hypothetical protein D3C87_1160150 [compost metagenome]
MVEHVVITHIGVGQHVVAKLLRAAQAAAVAHHQPAMRTQHGEVIGHRLRVRRPDADIDQRDAELVLAHEVVGRHLRQRARAGGVVGFAVAKVLGHVARFDEAHVAVAAIAGHQRAAQRHELIDITLIVREQDKALEVLRRRAGVVVEPLQGQVHALRGEQRERPGLARRGLVGAVGDGVVDAAQLGQHEGGFQLARLGVADVGGRGFDHERQRDWTARQANHHRHAVIAHQALDLVAVVVAQQVRPRDRGAVDAGVGYRTPRRAAVGHHGFEVDRDAEVRVARVGRRWEGLALREGVETRAHGGDRAVVDLANARQRAVRVRELGQLIGRMGGREDRGVHGNHHTARHRAVAAFDRVAWEYERLCALHRALFDASTSASLHSVAIRAAHRSFVAQTPLRSPLWLGVRHATWYLAGGAVDGNP